MSRAKDDARLLRECVELIEGDSYGYYGDITKALKDTADELDPPEPEYMSREEVLAFVTYENVVVRCRGNEWFQVGYFSFDNSIKEYEWAYIDEYGNIGEPQKFLKHGEK